IYKKKAKIKNVISAYESRKNSLKPEDKSYIFVIKILARLYLEDKPYQGESQQGSGENAKKAAAVLEEITAAEPNSIEDLAMLADLYLKSAEYEKAVTVYKKLTEIDKSQGLINHYQTLFMIYNKLSQTEEALEIFRVVMELKNSAIESLLAPANEFFNESFKNGNKKAVLLYGDCIISAYNRQKNVKAAMAAIDRILSVYPQEKAIIKRKGFLMLENDVETNIVEIFKDLCELFPGDIRIRYEYCRLLFKNKKFDESLAIIFDSFKKKENEDKYVELFSQISSILIKEKKYQRVIDLAPVAYKLSQSCVCLKCLAEAYLKSGDIDRANEIYLKTIELSPRDGEAEKRQKYIKNLIDERGILEMKSSSSEELELAIDGETVKVKRSSIDVESRVQVSPLEIQAAEAKLYYEKGDYKKAISIFQQLIKAAPESKRTLVMNIYLMNCFLKENLTAAAEKVYNSIDLKPLNLSAGEELAFKYKAGGIFLECGQLEKAEAIFSEIAAVDMGYKNAGEIITSIKEKIAARKAESLRQQQAPATDDSERTMIATIANETDYIDKRYKILGQIGKGGMGIVYKAIDTANQAQVAIKIPILTFKDDRGFMERFEREADVSSRLKHPNILNIFDVVKGELPYMVMELLVGHSLKEILKEKKSFTHIEMRDIAVQCCDALAYTHGLNIIHRDIKPENIMIVENDAVKIMDFGLAKALDESSVTKAGTIMGTFAYISPEQCLGEQIDGRADLYSLGIMLYEMLTGEKPFTSGDYVHQHLKVKPQAPTKKNPLIPYPVEAIVLKCIEKKPQDRYSSASELKDALLKIA
ncbi:MAG TPA: protein kinase, partial [Candidatus Wallbacteria bacterium]|nr:protein kinase [Candidatus Wallbacteria bacterium]